MRVGFGLLLAVLAGVLPAAEVQNMYEVSLPVTDQNQDSFMPWLVGTALLHSVMVQETRRLFKIWNVFLIIATFSVAGDRLFSQAESRSSYRRPRPSIAPASTLPRPSITQPSFRPAPKSLEPERSSYSRPEPSYHPVSMSGSKSNNPVTRR